MSALVGLGPLLDPGALWGIAQQLWAARERLALRTGANIPSASQLLVALRMYINDQDRRRADVLRSAALERPPQVEDLDGADRDGGDRGAHDSGGGSRAAGREGATQGQAAGSAPPSGVAVHELAHYLMLAEAAYADSKEELMAMLDLVGGEQGLLEARWYSSKCHPAYFIAYDAQLSAIVLSVRGSKEVADFITNLSCETAPFHGGYGHSGVVQSAQNLAAVIAANLHSYLEIHRPRHGLVVVGHSLGAAVASLVTIMLRTNTLEDHIHFAQPPPRRVASRRSSVSVACPPAPTSAWAAAVAERRRAPTDAARAIATDARCFAFSGPPCVSPRVARLARDLGVTTVVLGLDMVPRLSAGTLDGLLLAISRYDWRGELSGNVEDGLRGFLTQAMGAASGAAAAATVANVGPRLLGPIVGAVQRSAQAALTAAPASRPGRQGEGASRAAPPVMHPAQKVMLGALALGGSFLMHQFFQPAPAAAAGGGARGGVLGRERQPEYSFAARFGITPEQVEEALIPNQPEVLHLPGRLLHIDRPFTPPAQYREDASLPAGQLVERSPEYFSHVEASSWMLHDHHPPNIVFAVATLESAWPLT